MHTKTRVFLALAAINGIAAFAQTKIDLRTQGKSVDFSSATSTKPSKTGTAFPATCSTGETFFKTDAPAGSNLYGCTATNIWTVQSGSGGLPAVGGNTNKVLSNGGTAADWRALNGDISGAPDAVTVNAIRGRAIAVTAPVNSQVLGWNSTNNQWEPQNQSGTGSNATQFQGRNLAATAPNDTQVICWDTAGNTWKPCTAGSGGGGGASSVPQLTDLQTIRASAASLSVGGGNVEVNGVSYLILPGSIGISAGTGTVRIAIDTSVTPPAGKVYYTTGLTITCSGLSGCTTPVPASAFGSDDLQLASWTTTSGTFDLNGGTELRGIVSRSRTLAGTGMISSFSGHTQTLSVNTAVLPIFTLSPGTGTALPSGTTVVPTNRVHHVTGTSTISTITAAGMSDGEVLTLIPDASFATATGGNIAVSSTASVSRAMRFIWDASTAKWYPSY